MSTHRIESVPVDDPAQRRPLERLLREFHEWLRETAPEAYDPAAGLTQDVSSLERERASWAWLASHRDAPAGCVLLYGQTDNLAEFRRLWVTPDARGAGLGRALAQTVVETAQQEGYEVVGLTTPPWSEAAQRLYESMGFEETAPYPETRLDERYHEDAIFMQFDLRDAGTDRTDP